MLDVVLSYIAIQRKAAPEYGPILILRDMLNKVVKVSVWWTLGRVSTRWHISLPVRKRVSRKYRRVITTNIIESINQRARQLIANVLSNTRQPAPRGGDSLLEFLEGLIDWSIFNSGAS